MSETVDFDTHPGVLCSGIFQILEGYSKDGEPPVPKILVILTNGAVLELDVTPTNSSAASSWRKWKLKQTHVPG